MLGKIQEFPLSSVKIHDQFWSERLKMNENVAIFYQWEQLETSRCIDNFRILAENKDTFREGLFFADSDAYKWLDAASRILTTSQDEKTKQKLLPLIDALIDLISKCQQQDGYIFTYNQILFPKARWKNLQLEHELYCTGHLIEGAISHFEATGDPKLLKIAEKAAHLVVSQFNNEDPKLTPGHQEIELALIKLYRVTQNKDYLAMAECFLRKRGRIRLFLPHFFGNVISAAYRSIAINTQHRRFMKKHPNQPKFKLPGHVVSKLPHGIVLRLLQNMASGRYNQQHVPIEKQLVPEGHSVRYGYMQTAITMLARESTSSNEDLRAMLAASWDHMVQKRMFVTGGTGSIPLSEGYGFDYELDPEYAYCETCAAISTVLWNREMALLTHETNDKQSNSIHNDLYTDSNNEKTYDAKYDELLEWQMFNSVNSGMSLDGKTYLYRNPQQSKGDLTREAWFTVPCCPPNLSRTLASIGKSIYSFMDNSLWIHQYIGSKTHFGIHEGQLVFDEKNAFLHFTIESNLPWAGHVSIRIQNKNKMDSGVFIKNLPSIWCRIPGWSDEVKVTVNGKPVHLEKRENSLIETASGYSPYNGYYLKIDTNAFLPDGENIIDINMKMGIHLISPHPKAQKKSKLLRNRVFIAHGPLIYCIEDVDNPNVGIFHTKILKNSLSVAYDPDLLSGTNVVTCKSKDGSNLTLIPYYLWANRGRSKMSCVFDVEK